MNKPITEKAFRRKLVKMVADIDSLLATAEYIAARRPHMAPSMAPDAFADVLRQRPWALQAITALDAGEAIPPPPRGNG